LDGKWEDLLPVESVLPHQTPGWNPLARLFFGGPIVWIHALEDFLGQIRIQISNALRAKAMGTFQVEALTYEIFHPLPTPG
jgi:hypothetical protein